MSARQEPRVGLVLGAGGILGAAWLAGALHAIATESGWDPGSADHVVGTSAGSIIGALLACGVPPWLMVAHSAGEGLDGLTHANGDAVGAAGQWTGASIRPHRGVPAVGPGSWRLALGSLARPYGTRPRR
jgi:NTE family protein